MRFLQGEGFTPSMRDHSQKGGSYQKAAQTIYGIWEQVNQTANCSESGAPDINPRSNHREKG